jgi:hypothetical protein
VRYEYDQFSDHEIYRGNSRADVNIFKKCSNCLLTVVEPERAMNKLGKHMSCDSERINLSGTELSSHHLDASTVSTNARSTRGFRTRERARQLLLRNVSLETNQNGQCH